MTGSNHVITGALIAAVVPQPLVAIPLAFLSHFVLDTLPHYGHEHDERYWLTKTYTKVLVTDALLINSFFISLLIIRPEHWLLIGACAVVAVLPDILWIPYYLHDRRHPESKQRNAVSKFLKRIQLGERPWGIFVELAWLVVFGGIFLSVVF